MKKHFSLFLIFFKCMTFYSQINYEKGYYINNEGNKIEGLIKNIDWQNNPTYFEFKTSELAEGQTIKIESAKEFGVYKFRRLKMKYCTTNDNPEALKFEQELIDTKDMRNDGVLYKIQNDPRATKIGTFLEKSSLDEIPQLINILTGDMSLIGP